MLGIDLATALLIAGIIVLCATTAITALALPSFEEMKTDKVTFARATAVMHRESNPFNARRLSQDHGGRVVVQNPPELPLTAAQMDAVYDLPYQRRAHPSYAEPIPAETMMRTSVTIMRGCFGGCTFCSITEHEGRIIQNRSEESILEEVEKIRDTAPGFTGVISDLGGRMQRVDRALVSLDALELEIVEQQSELRDTDIEEAITRLANLQITYEAAMLANSKILNFTLTDYLR